VNAARGLLFVAAAQAALACSTLAAHEQPAVIAQATDGSRAELARIVSAAFDGQAVTIADDALTRDSLLLIERRELRGLRGRAFGGRVLEMPEQFRLILRAATCELIRGSDGRRWEFTQTDCVPNRNLAGR
jgi:hypothetical protein